MPAAPTTSVNLLGSQADANSPWNRLMNWVTTYGRYIMVITELVVLLAFMSRFSLDRKLTDLKENISQKQQVLEINADIEKDIKTTQDKITDIKTLLTDQDKPVKALDEIHRILPQGVFLEKLTIDNMKLTTTITATTTEGLSRLLANLSNTKFFQSIDIGGITKQQNGIKITLIAALKNPPKTQKN